MQHVAHRASDSRAHPTLGRDIRNKIAHGLRATFEPDTMPPMPPAMADALAKLAAMDKCEGQK